MDLATLVSKDYVIYEVRRNTPESNPEHVPVRAVAVGTPRVVKIMYNLSEKQVRDTVSSVEGIPENANAYMTGDGEETVWAGGKYWTTPVQFYHKI